MRIIGRDITTHKHNHLTSSVRFTISPLASTLLEFVKTGLERRADLLERWLLLWTATVVLGLLLEYGGVFATHSPFPRRLWPKEPKVFIWITPFEILGGILITIGVAGELYVEVTASSVREALRSIEAGIIANLNRESTEARKSAALAIKDAALANKQAASAGEQAALAKRETAEATVRAEAERLARVQLEARIAPRNLTVEEQRFLIRVCSRFATLFFGRRIRIETYALDVEAARFATILASVLRNAGIQVDLALANSMPLGGFETGVHIHGSPRDRYFMLQLATFLHVDTDSDVFAEWNPLTTNTLSPLVIMVGVKPIRLAPSP